MAEQVETERRKWARDKLVKMLESGEIPKNSAEGEDVARILKYLSPLDDYFLERKKVMKERIPVILGAVDAPEYTLLKMAFTTNLSEGEMIGAIKAYIKRNWRDCPLKEASKETKKRWADSGRDGGRRVYRRLCDYLEIKPEENFPDW